MRDEVLASQPQDWRAVARGPGRSDEPAPVFYQKHMTHHMLPGFGLDWTARLPQRLPDPRSGRGAGLLREEARRGDAGGHRRGPPARAVRPRGRPAGAAPPVVEGADVLADPRGMLGALCAALGIPFREEMLSWPAGPRASDGVWAPAWYEAVERSTGFAAPDAMRRRPLTDDLTTDRRAGAAALRGVGALEAAPRRPRPGCACRGR